MTLHATDVTIANQVTQERAKLLIYSSRNLNRLSLGNAHGESLVFRTLVRFQRRSNRGSSLCVLTTAMTQDGPHRNTRFIRNVMEVNAARR